MRKSGNQFRWGLVIKFDTNKNILMNIDYFLQCMWQWDSIGGQGEVFVRHFVVTQFGVTSMWIL